MIKAILTTFLSRKFITTAIAVALLVWFHQKTVADLERLPVDKAASLVTIFNVTSGVLGAILVGYLGFNTLQTRFGLSGVAQVLSENKTNTTITVDETAKNENLREHKDE